MANPEALTIPQEGGPEIVVPSRKVEAFHALEVLTRGEHVAPQFIAATLRDGYVHPNDQRRAIVGLARADRSIRNGDSELVLAEVSAYSEDPPTIRLAETVEDSGITVQKTRRRSRGLTLDVKWLENIDDVDGTVESEDDEPQLDMAVPVVSLDIDGDTYEWRRVYDSLRWGNTLFIVGSEAVSRYLEERAIEELAQERQSDYFGSGEIDFAESSTILALARLKQRGYHLTAMTSPLVTEKGQEVIAKMVAEGFGVQTGLYEERTPKDYIERLGGVWFGPHDAHPIARKAKEMIREDDSIDEAPLEKTVAAAGGNFEELVVSQSSNLLRNLLGVR